MSRNPTWTDPTGFFKRYADAATATRALMRSTAARTADVPTPAACQTADETVLRFDLVTGGPVAAGDTAAQLSVLTCLCRMEMKGLPAYDPFLRIDARLGAVRHAPAYSALKDMIEHLRSVPLPTQGTLHGDFHPGQVLRDDAGALWVIDLDDMARGPVEADLGNLAAWRLTQAGMPPPDLSSLARETQALCTAWTRMDGGGDPALALHFARIALIRRALKLAERGRRDLLEGIVSAA